MPPERPVDRADLADRTADSPGDRAPCALDLAAHAARPAGEAERTGERRDQLVELLASAGRAAEVARAVAVVDLLLEVADPGAHLAPRALVQHDVCARRLALASGELQA